MTLAYETLHEAVESSPQCAIQLFYAVRNIFELYCGVFPTYHRQSLATLPQLTGWSMLNMWSIVDLFYVAIYATSKCVQDVSYYSSIIIMAIISKF